MFILVLGAVLLLLHVYVWKRMVYDTTRTGRVRWALTVVLIMLMLLLVTALFAERIFDKEESAWLAWPGFLWFGLIAYLFLSLLVFEPVRLALRARAKRKPEITEPTPNEPATDDEPQPALDRRLFIARVGAVAAAVTSVGLVGFGAATAIGPPNLLRVSARLRKLDPAFNGFRIAVVSDIHIGPLAGRAHTERIVRMINETAPDLVAVVGDLVDGTVEALGAAAEPLQDLVSREGSFFVTGNHEYFVDDTLDWLRELSRLGVHPLRNENTVIRRGSAAFGLAGVNDLAGRSHSDGPNFDRALSGLDPAQPRILLAHQPVQVRQAAVHGVDLQLSGHTHGGQVWPFHYAVRAIQPSLAGLSTVDGTQLYVTRGAGFWGPPVRVGAPPDITEISLQSDSLRLRRPTGRARVRMEPVTREVVPSMTTERDHENQSLLRGNRGGDCRSGRIGLQQF